MPGWVDGEGRVVDVTWRDATTDECGFCHGSGETWVENENEDGDAEEEEEE